MEAASAGDEKGSTLRHWMDGWQYNMGADIKWKKNINPFHLTFICSLAFLSAKSFATIHVIHFDEDATQLALSLIIETH